MEKQNFNIIIAGVGGQGLITLLEVVARAALDKGYDIKTSELHGLSQRGGSVSVHIRFGKKACPVRRNDSFCLTGVYSPIVPLRKADLIFVLEFQEALNAAEYASKKSIFLLNKYQTPTLLESVSEEQVKSDLKKIAKKAFFIPASEVCQKELQNSVVAGIFLLGCALYRNFLPFEETEIKKAMQETMPEKYWDLNLKALELAKNFNF